MPKKSKETTLSLLLIMGGICFGSQLQLLDSKWGNELYCRYGRKAKPDTSKQAIYLHFQVDVVCLVLNV